MIEEYWIIYILYRKIIYKIDDVCGVILKYVYVCFVVYII